MANAFNRRYILNGFPDRAAAWARSREMLLSQCEKYGTKPGDLEIMFEPACLQQEQWGLLVKSDCFEWLNQNEQSTYRLREIIETPFNVGYMPRVYRYLESQFVDLFFETGKIQLSSFANFRGHSDEQRGDRSEGSSIMTGIGREQTVYSTLSFGDDSYILCASLLKDPSLLSDFNVDSGIIIDNPQRFLQEVANELSSFHGVIYGPCQYDPSLGYETNANPFNLENAKLDEGEGLSMSKMNQMLNQTAGDHILFRKSIKYAPQHEYRFVWRTFGQVSDNVIVTLPEPEQYCRRLQFDK